MPSEVSRGMPVGKLSPVYVSTCVAISAGEGSRRGKSHRYPQPQIADLFSGHIVVPMSIQATVALSKLSGR